MKPNFFIVGTQKAGTTSLYHYLNQHNEVYMSPVKEPLFFSHHIDPYGNALKHRFTRPRLPQNPRFANVEGYERLYEGVGDEKAIGEASTLYIYGAGTAERIKRYAPDAKIIAILRNPADRAYSAFLYALRLGVEPLTDFAQALRVEQRRINNGWHYVYRYFDRGLYHKQIKAYYDVFGPERVGIWLYEDLKEDPRGVAKNVFRFLDVDDSFVPDTSLRHNPASVPKNSVSRVVIRGMNVAFPLAKKVVPSTSVRARDQWDYKVRRLVNEWILVDKPPPFDLDLRARLIGDYREDILRLQTLTDLDLSDWLR